MTRAGQATSPGVQRHVRLSTYVGCVCSTEKGDARGPFGAHTCWPQRADLFSLAHSSRIPGPHPGYPAACIVGQRKRVARDVAMDAARSPANGASALSHARPANRPRNAAARLLRRAAKRARLQSCVPAGARCISIVPAAVPRAARRSTARRGCARARDGQGSRSRGGLQGFRGGAGGGRCKTLAACTTVPRYCTARALAASGLQRRLRAGRASHAPGAT